MLNLSAPQYFRAIAKPVTNAETIATIEQSYGEDVTIFEVDRTIASLQCTWDAEYEDYAGKIYGEEKNGSKHSLFNILEHGYNGLFKLYDSDEKFENRTIHLEEGTRIIIAFQYSDERAEYAAEVGNGAVEEDVFDWIAVFLLKGEELTLFADFECA